MRKSLFLFLAALVLASCSADQEPQSATANPSPTENPGNVNVPYSYDQDELLMVRLINEHRQQIGKGSLVLQNYMSITSEDHNSYMIENNVVNHDFFNDRAADLREVLGADHVGENVAYNYQSAQGAFDAWMGSDGHRAAIEGAFTHVGISVSSDAQGHKYYTALFARLPVE